MRIGAFRETVRKHWRGKRLPRFVLSHQAIDICAEDNGNVRARANLFCHRGDQTSD
ncbi:hypothetical protein [Bradyrhizobium yuanmingense]|uniref:hypothetical protein n=1 Tax=Bradyrhizobium yuanmingense TaxID=108015 RepID=UPI0023B8EB01|nr:hypothetical protein [Bradyrhizobium yuanmingense]MDF0498059.1 hypothetical protein [Bradyrhizobium yuanmingense]